MTSTFDPSTFMDLAVSEANDTKLIPVPVGEYPATASKVEVNTWQSKDGTKSGLRLDISWDLDLSARAPDGKTLKEVIQRERAVVRQGVMLDLNDNGGLDMGKGKNIGMGRLREGLGLNAGGQSFSFRMIEGRPAKVKIRHRPNEDRPENGPFVDVDGVAKLA